MSCEIGVKKPDVEIFQKCMKDLEVAAEECIYVGDGGSFELETAQALGIEFGGYYEGRYRCKRYHMEQ